MTLTTTKIWLSSPHMGENEQRYVKDAFDTNWVAPLGPNVNGFESSLGLVFLEYLKGTKYYVKVLPFPPLPIPFVIWGPSLSL